MSSSEIPKLWQKNKTKKQTHDKSLINDNILDIKYKTDIFHWCFKNHDELINFLWVQ